jgi:hypothetical protein
MYEVNTRWQKFANLTKWVVVIRCVAPWAPKMCRLRLPLGVPSSPRCSPINNMSY